jgi:hypothetical protein
MHSVNNYVKSVDVQQAKISTYTKTAKISHSGPMPPFGTTRYVGVNILLQNMHTFTSKWNQLCVHNKTDSSLYCSVLDYKVNFPDDVGGHHENMLEYCLKFIQTF